MNKIVLLSKVKILLIISLMEELHQKLLGESSHKLQSTRNTDFKNRLTLIVQEKNLDNRSSFQIQDWQNNKKMYRSIMQQPDFGWNYEEIMERSMLMEQQHQIDTQQHFIQQANIASVSKQKSKAVVQPKIAQAAGTQNTKKKKELNSRIFNLKPKQRAFIYYFNLFFNILFRIGLVILLIELIVEGDGDQDHKEEKIFIQVLLSLQGLVSLLYFLAIIKMLYTKSSDISVYFQKQFYEKPYAEIHMQRIMRKHFTFNKIVSNLTRMANPCSKFSKDPKISIMRQQIYKRIEIVFVFAPLMVLFIIGIKWFTNTDETTNKFDVRLLMAVVVSMQAVHLTLHYILVYIFS